MIEMKPTEEIAHCLKGYGRLSQATRRTIAAGRQGKAIRCTEAIMATQIGPREAQLRAQREQAFTPAARSGRTSQQPARKEEAMAKAKPMPPKGGKKGKGGKGC